MKLYHGTNYSSAMDICANGIDLKHSQQYLDFGAGFYATPSYEHAAITAIRKTDKFNAKKGTQEEPYIVEIKYVPQSRIELNMIQYPRHCKEWGEFVLNNRLTKDILDEYNIVVHNQDFRYDVCIGEIADGEVVNTAYQVNNRTLEPKDVNFNQFLNSNGKVYPLQYSFHTIKAISCISDISCGIIYNKEKYLRKVVKRKKVNSMTNAQIREFKKYVREVLVNKYSMNELDAQRAVRASYLSVALERDKDYVEHDTVEEWADFVFEEVNNNELMRM